MIGSSSVSDVGAGVLGQLAALAIDPLAVVVELGGGPQQAILQRVLFAPQRVERVGLLGPCRGAFVGCGGGLLRILIVDLIRHVRFLRAEPLAG